MEEWFTGVAAASAANKESLADTADTYRQALEIDLSCKITRNLLGATLERLGEITNAVQEYVARSLTRPPLRLPSPTCGASDGMVWEGVRVCDLAGRLFGAFGPLPVIV